MIGDAPNINFEAESIFSPDIGGVVAGQSHDQLKLAGYLSLGDGEQLPILEPKLSYIPIVGDLMFLVTNDSTSAVAGLFKSPGGVALGQGAILPILSSADGKTYYFEISYLGDANSGQFQTLRGNDITFRAVAIPEPKSLALLLLGIAAGWRSRIRLNRSALLPW